MRLTLIFATLIWTQISADICEETLQQLVTGNEDDYCNTAGLSGKKLENDLAWNDLKKCCGASDNFKYDCVRYDTHCNL